MTSLVPSSELWSPFLAAYTRTSESDPDLIDALLRLRKVHWQAYTLSASGLCSIYRAEEKYCVSEVIGALSYKNLRVHNEKSSIALPRREEDCHLLDYSMLGKVNDQETLVFDVMQKENFSPVKKPKATSVKSRV